MAVFNVLLDGVAAHPFVMILALPIIGLALYEFLRPKMPFEIHPRPPKLPVIGMRRGDWFPKLRAMWRNSRDIRVATQEAYQYKKEACLLPIFDVGDVVILPPTEIPWFHEQSDVDLSGHVQQLNSFQLKYTLMDPRIVEDNLPIHEHLIHTALTRQTNNLLPSMADEVARSVDAIWGTDTENFKELCLMEEMQSIVAQVVNRVFVGSPMCSNKTLVDAAVSNALGVGFNSLLLRVTPQWLRPLAGPILTLQCRIATWRFYNALRPEVRRRLEELAGADSTPAEKSGSSERGHNDFLQWTIEAAVQSGDPYMMKLNTIMARVLIINFVSIHTSSFAISHILLDLAANSPDYIDELRVEIVTALEKHHGQWNKRPLNDMPKLDSAFRESQRMSALPVITSNKPVCTRKGLTTPSGVHLPYGTNVGILSWPVLHDPSIYQDPETFKPFRFAEQREVAGQHGMAMEKASLGWVSVTKAFTAFGSGRHACPGRFYASNMLKILLAYVLLNYDIEKLPERPMSPTFSAALMPPLKATIRFKRRKEPLYNLQRASPSSLS